VLMPPPETHRRGDRGRAPGCAPPGGLPPGRIVGWESTPESAERWPPDGAGWREATRSTWPPLFAASDSKGGSVWPRSISTDSRPRWHPGLPNCVEGAGGCGQRWRVWLSQATISLLACVRADRLSGLLARALARSASQRLTCFLAWRLEPLGVSGVIVGRAIYRQAAVGFSPRRLAGRGPRPLGGTPSRFSVC